MINKAELLAAAQKVFTDDALKTRSEEDLIEGTLAVQIAHFFEWDGLAIMRVAALALQDANFHTEAAKIITMCEAIEQRF